MAKYIDRDELLRLLNDRYESIADINSLIIDMEPADVIERAEYEKLRLVNLDLAETTKGLLAEHEQLLKLRSKIDNAIEEIRNLRQQYRNDDYYDCRWEVLEILKKNIGE